MTSQSFTPAWSEWDEVQRNHLVPVRSPTRSVCRCVLLLICAAGTLGCQANIQAPRSADKHAQHDGKSRDAPVLDYPEHVAPPPAYGNKVVMAVSSEATAHF